ncbi:unnamed protein product [Prorocentrum cordatum]|uniref:Ion transport domain-containing protein n=1 Tax=Prorocentrum cordatum TaxID=2364126 RepID=A0ABN9VWQ3_9DINO|nr:unnamed protein product [Polarella glacialis]
MSTTVLHDQCGMYSDSDNLAILAAWAGWFDRPFLLQQDSNIQRRRADGVTAGRVGRQFLGAEAVRPLPELLDRRLRKNFQRTATEMFAPRGTAALEPRLRRKLNSSDDSELVLHGVRLAAMRPALQQACREVVKGDRRARSVYDAAQARWQWPFALAAATRLRLSWFFFGCSKGFIMLSWEWVSAALGHVGLPALLLPGVQRLVHARRAFLTRSGDVLPLVSFFAGYSQGRVREVGPPRFASLDQHAAAVESGLISLDRVLWTCVPVEVLGAMPRVFECAEAAARALASAVAAACARLRRAQALPRWEKAIWLVKASPSDEHDLGVRGKGCAFAGVISRSRRAGLDQRAGVGEGAPQRGSEGRALREPHGMSDQYDRVLLRLSSAEDDKLDPILEKLLPLVFDELLTQTDAALRTKIVGVLNHVLTRVKGNQKIKLPVLGIAERWFAPRLATSPNAPFFRNLSIIFLDLGVPRLAAVEQIDLALFVMENFARLAAGQDRPVLFLAATFGLSQIAVEGLRKDQVPRCLALLCGKPADDPGLVGFFSAASEFLLIPSSAPQAPAVAGMSSSCWVHWKARLKTKAAADMIALKMSILRWLGSLGASAPASLVYLPSLMATCENYEAVSNAADSNCKRLDPELDLSADTALLGRLVCSALTSSPPGLEDAAGPFAVETKSSVPAKLRIRVASLLQRSQGIGGQELFRHVVHLVRQGLRDHETVQIAVQQLALVLAEKIEPELLVPTAADVLHEVEAVFFPDGGQVLVNPASSLSFRVYGSFARHLSEQPSQEGRALALRGAPRMLALLAMNDSAAQDILEALSGLVSCMVGAIEEEYRQFVPLLDRLVTTPKAVVRREVLRWSTTLFPASAPEGRYYALRLFNDLDPDISRSAETALAGGGREVPRFDTMCSFLAARAVDAPEGGCADRLQVHCAKLAEVSPELPPLASNFTLRDVARAVAFVLRLADAEGIACAGGAIGPDPPQAKRPRLADGAKLAEAPEGARRGATQAGRRSSAQLPRAAAAGMSLAPMHPGLFRQRLLELASEYEGLHAEVPAAPADPTEGGVAASLGEGERAGSGSGSTMPPAQAVPPPTTWPSMISDLSDNSHYIGGDTLAQPNSGTVARHRIPLFPMKLSRRDSANTQRSERTSVAISEAPSEDGRTRAPNQTQSTSQLSIFSKHVRSQFAKMNSQSSAESATASQTAEMKFNDMVRKSMTFTDGLRTSSRSLQQSEKRPFASFVKSRCFAVASALLIIMSTLLIGIETQVLSALSHQGSDSDHLLNVLSAANYILTFMFTVEVVLRIHVLGVMHPRDRMWNCFDIIILSLALVEVALDIFVHTLAGNERNPFDHGGMAKMLRLFRLTRLLRIVRTFRQLKPLRVLVHSIVSAGKSVFWALMLLIMIVFAFGVILTQAVTQHTKGGTRVDDEDLLLFYGDLFRSMLSLWMAVSGGINWHELTAPLVETGDATWMMLFLVYITFVYFFIEGQRILSERNRGGPNGFGPHH